MGVANTDELTGALQRYSGGEFVCALPQADLPAAEARVLEVSSGLAAVVPHATVSVGLVQMSNSYVWAP